MSSRAKTFVFRQTDLISQKLRDQEGSPAIIQDLLYEGLI
jgi:hypothetical protein